MQFINRTFSIIEMAIHNTVMAMALRESVVKGLIAIAIAAPLMNMAYGLKAVTVLCCW